MDTLLSMRAFCSVVERESFAGAARSLGISTAMASKHVMALEQRLGTRLLNRTSRHVSLTESGALYFERCRQMLEDLEDVEASVSRVTASPRGLLKVTAPVWLANPTFTAVLADYQAAFPEVRLDIDLSGRIVNLVEEGVDLALRGERSLGDTLVARPIANVLFQWVGAPAYFKRAGRPEVTRDLADHRLLLYSLMTADSERTRALTGGAEMVSVLQSTNESLLHLAALQGMGLALLPTWLMADDVAAGRLEVVLAQSQKLEVRLCGVYPSRRYLSSKVRSFLDFVCADDRLREG
jgi:DNA-binding transcriptional LysR family regulator